MARPGNKLKTTGFKRILWTRDASRQQLRCNVVHGLTPLLHGIGCVQSFVRQDWTSASFKGRSHCIVTGEYTAYLCVPVVSGTDVGQPCTPGGTPCADVNAECVGNICRCRQGYFSRNGFCSERYATRNKAQTPLVRFAVDLLLICCIQHYYSPQKIEAVESEP